MIENYRLISVINVLSKVIERRVYSQLSDYFERNKLLSCSQYGFRQGRSTVQLTTLRKMGIMEIVLEFYIRISRRHLTLSIMPNFCLHKVQFYGIKGKELEWFTDYCGI